MVGSLRLSCVRLVNDAISIVSCYFRFVFRAVSKNQIRRVFPDGIGFYIPVLVDHTALLLYIQLSSRILL